MRKKHLNNENKSFMAPKNLLEVSSNDFCELEMKYQLIKSIYPSILLLPLTHAKAI